MRGLRTLLHASPPPLQTHQARDQNASPLFRLPFELREIIWSLVLHPGDSTQTAHFHVYAEVWNSCTYNMQSAVDRLARKAGLRTALLRTCWAMHEEAVQVCQMIQISQHSKRMDVVIIKPVSLTRFLQLLYDPTNFEIVLFSGIARPDAVHVPFLNECRSQSLATRCNVGQPSVYTNLKRIRHLTLIVQPGRWAHVPKFVQRVHTTLKALDYGRNLKQTCLKFHFNLETDWQATAVPIIKAFHILNHRQTALGSSQAQKLTITPCYPYLPITSIPYEDAIGELAHALGIPTINIIPLYPGDTYSAGECAAHGLGLCNNIRNRRGVPTRSQAIVANVASGLTLGAVVLTAPLSIPCIVWTLAARTRRKGESWKAWFA
ncbi:hypothetical protein LTR56_021843 [Elasticomyces elasticus]|nr:hypothetical protein LTR56_021843 [Elasticomyces elasticus]KAK3641644.1 hypothetical protein LTR22_016462 [Elasticomyces elasticus]KAK4906069.1 hypothetical protein LTR49_024733 [Elasticomyces elasticus]KAK5743722.1 hypothetical protein LTS12_023759 [Elasticomyces elasticus]